MFLTSFALQEESSTFGQIVESIPRDASAMLVYALMAGFVFLIWVGSRKATR